MQPFCVSQNKNSKMADENGDAPQEYLPSSSIAMNKNAMGGGGVKWLKSKNFFQNKPFFGLTNLHKLFWAFYFCKIIIITKT